MTSWFADIGASLEPESALELHNVKLLDTFYGWLQGVSTEYLQMAYCTRSKL